MNTDEQRTTRLVGDGTSGGGLPLPDAFRAILERLLDDGPATPPELAKVVQNALAFKREKVLADFGSWRKFTNDLLAQLQYAGLIESSDLGKTALTGKFRTREPLKVIPEADITVTIYAPDDREMLEQASELQLEINVLRSKIAAAGRLTLYAGDLLARLNRAVDVGTHPSQHRPRPTQVGRDMPPPDEPDVLLMCKDCGKDKPKTREYFRIYQSRSRYYWDAAHCDQCQLDRRVTARPDIDYRQAVYDGVTKLYQEAGRIPAASEVARHLGIDDKPVRRYWDQFTAKGQLPPRERNSVAQ